MRARAVVRAAAGGRGTALTELRAEAPLGLYPGRADVDGWAQVWLVGSAGGPLGGDDLELRIEVGDGAALSIGSVAASVALAGPAPSMTRVHAVVGHGAALSWNPEPLIVTGRADHRVEVRLDVAADADVWWRDVLALGRTGEEPGRATVALRADRAGRPWVRHEIGVGVPGFDGPAVLGPARVVGSVLASADPGVPGRPAERGLAELRPEAGGSITVALAADRPALDRSLAVRALVARPLPAGLCPPSPQPRSRHVAVSR